MLPHTTVVADLTRSESLIPDDAVGHLPHLWASQCTAENRGNDDQTGIAGLDNAAPEQDPSEGGCCGGGGGVCTASHEHPLQMTSKQCSPDAEGQHEQSQRLTGMPQPLHATTGQRHVIVHS